MTERTKALRTTDVTENLVGESLLFCLVEKEKFRECMHGILHMEQNFKGEFLQSVFQVHPLLIQAFCLFVFSLFVSLQGLIYASEP